MGTVHSPPVEGWPMHFAMHAFSSHAEVLNKVTPIDLLVQSAVLFSLTGWLLRISTVYTFIQFMETKTKWRKRLGSCKHDACSGGHASPPLRLGGLHKFMAQAATVVQRYFFNSPPIHRERSS